MLGSASKLLRGSKPYKYLLQLGSRTLTSEINKIWSEIPQIWLNHKILLEFCLDNKWIEAGVRPCMSHAWVTLQVETRAERYGTATLYVEANSSVDEIEEDNIKSAPSLRFIFYFCHQYIISDRVKVVNGDFCLLNIGLCDEQAYLDWKAIRDNLEEVKLGVKSRNSEADPDKVCRLYDEFREAQDKVEQLRADRNANASSMKVQLWQTDFKFEYLTTAFLCSLPWLLFIQPFCFRYRRACFYTCSDLCSYSSATYDSEPKVGPWLPHRN